jgi:hypothetical protein
VIGVAAPWASMLASLLTVDLASAKKTARRKAWIYGLLAVALATAYVAAVSGGVLMLAAAYGPVAAAFLAAAAALTVALCVLAANIVIDRRERRRRELRVATRSLIATTAAAFLPRILKSPVLATAVVVAVAGYFALQNNDSTDGD